MCLGHEGHITSSIGCSRSSNLYQLPLVPLDGFLFIPEARSHTLGSCLLNKAEEIITAEFHKIPLMFISSFSKNQWKGCFELSYSV